MWASNFLLVLELNLLGDERRQTKNLSIKISLDMNSVNVFNSLQSN